MTSLYGRKPSMPDLGYGWVYAGQERASIMGQPPVDGRVIRMGMRCGRKDSGTPRVWMGVYATENANNVTALMRQSHPFDASIYMPDHHHGANYEANMNGVARVLKRYQYALAFFASGHRLTHGQDLSGHTMFQNSQEVGLTNPFASTKTTPEGKMSIWAYIQANRPPNTPKDVQPTPDSMTSNAQPTLGATFSDPDEGLTNYAPLDEWVKSYRFEIYDSSGVSRLHDSGVISADATQRANKRVSWTVLSALASARYQARCTMWDEFDAPSPTATWYFTINPGGSVSNPIVLDLAPGSSTTTTNVNPRMQGTWTHASGLSGTHYQLGLLNESGTMIQGPSGEVAATIGVNTSVVQSIGGVGGVVLSRGSKYRLAMRIKDSGGLWSGWAYTPLFTVNALPNIPTTLRPANGFVTSDLPELSATITDANDATETLSSQFYVRQQGGTGNGSLVAARGFASGRHYARPSSADVPSRAVWEWRARGVDKYGEVGGYSAWQSFTYANPPTVSITAPANNAVLTSGTPTISFTSSEAMSKYRIIARNVANGVIDYSVEVVATGTSANHTIAEAKLRNQTTYDITVEITSTTGLVGSSVVRIGIGYTKPSALAGVRLERIAGPYERPDTPLEWSRIRIEWDAATITQVADNEWNGYRIKRRDLETDEEIVIGKSLQRAATSFVDKTPISGRAYRYIVVYRAIKNNLDWVESEEASAAGSLTLRSSVLASLDADDVGFPLRYWEGREVEHIRDQQIIPTWGATPIIFTGPANYKVLTGQFQEIDTPFFSAREIESAVERATEPDIDENGDTTPRILFYRDPKGRGFACVGTSNTETDHHIQNRVSLDLTVTEVDADLNVAD